MAAKLYYSPFIPAFDSNGLPISGASLTFYQSGTSTPQPIYTDSGLSIEATNPVVANAAGRFDSIYLDDSLVYRVVIKDAGGAVLDDIDPYVPGQALKGDPGSPGEGYSTRAALASAGNAATALDDSYLTEAQREGKWVYTSADISTEVAADTQQGLFIARADDATGATGGWVRKFDGPALFRWFGPAGDGATDDSAKLTAALAAIQYTDRREIKFDAKPYVLGAVKMWNDTQLIGSGWTNYSSSAETYTGITRLVRLTGAAGIIDLAGAKNVTMRDIDFDGSGGQAASAGDGIYDSLARITGGTGNASSITLTRVKAYDCNRGLIGDGGDPLADVHAVTCCFRQNNGGVATARDSFFFDCIFSANRSYGMSINQGQVTIANCYFEWQRGATGNTPANGLTLGNNAQEIIVSNCQFDRNSGYDIKMFSGSTGQLDILITNNLFKRAAWSPGLSDSDRISIKCIDPDADGVTISNNIWQVGDYGPSTVQGLHSPLKAVTYAGKNLTLKGNDFDDFNTPYDLNYNRVWVASASGTNEYYLTYTDEVWLVEPNYIFANDTSLSSGTAGTLAEGAWDWADNDSLGYSTIYVRVAGGVNPNTLNMTAAWAQEPFTFTGSGLVTDSFRDRWRGNGWSTAQNFTLKTRMNGSSNNTYRVVELLLFGRRHGANEAAHRIPVIFYRGTGGAMTTKIGTIETLETGFTLTASGGGGDVTIDVSAVQFGSDLDITLTPSAGTYSLEVQAKW